jgi:hypothetical protein
MAKPVVHKTIKKSKQPKNKKSKQPIQKHPFLRRYAWLAVFIFVLLIVGASRILPTLAATTSPTGSIIGIANKCVDVHAGQAYSGNTVWLYTCNGTVAQKWTMSSDSTIRNQGYCLDVKNGVKTVGTLVWLYSCNGTGAQKWVVQPNGEIVNPQSNLCLDDKWGNTTDTNPLWIYTCNATLAQTWTVPKAGVSPPPTPTPMPTPSPTPTPTPPTPTGNSPSGQAMPVGDLTGWHQVFADDFTASAKVGSFPGSTYSSKWAVYNEGWPDTSHNGQQCPNEVLSVQSGVLNYYLHTLSNGTHCVADPFPKVAGAAGKEGGQTYGRYSVRFKSDSIAHYAAAFLLWPDSESWPNDGEVDFPEGTLNGNINAFAHYASASGGQNAFTTNKSFSGWHTATVEWTPGKIVFYLDGVIVGTSTTDVPSKPMHWVLQTDTAYGAVPLNSDGGNIQIDWVTIYTRQ